MSYSFRVRVTYAEIGRLAQAWQTNSQPESPRYPGPPGLVNNPGWYLRSSFLNVHVTRAS